MVAYFNDVMGTWLNCVLVNTTGQEWLDWPWRGVRMQGWCSILRWRKYELMEFNKTGVSDGHSEVIYIDWRILVNMVVFFFKDLRKGGGVRAGDTDIYAYQTECFPVTHFNCFMFLLCFKLFNILYIYNNHSGKRMTLAWHRSEFRKTGEVFYLGRNKIWACDI